MSLHLAFLSLIIYLGKLSMLIYGDLPHSFKIVLSCFMHVTLCYTVCPLIFVSFASCFFFVCVINDFAVIILIHVSLHMYENFCRTYNSKNK